MIHFFSHGHSLRSSVPSAGAASSGAHPTLSFDRARSRRRGPPRLWRAQQDDRRPTPDLDPYGTPSRRDGLDQTRREEPYQGGRHPHFLGVASAVTGVALGLLIVLSAARCRARAEDHRMEAYYRMMHDSLEAMTK